MSQRPDPRRAPLPYQANLRLSDPAYRAASMLALARGCSVAQVCRDALDRELERFKDKSGRSILDRARQEPGLRPTADELADLVRDEDGAAHA